jgi:hypothetical protein
VVTTADALTVLYPAAVPLVDYVVADAGAGPAITFWSATLGPQPTPAQLDAVTDQQVTAARTAREQNLYDFVLQVEARLTAVDADVTLTQGSPTLNQLTRVVRDMLQWERKLDRALRRDLEREGFR